MAIGGKREGAGRKPGVPNKANAEIKAAAQKHGPDMIEALVTIAKAAESEAARVSAINSVLDRAYGKPAQAVQHGGNIGTYDLTKATDDDLDRLQSVLTRIAVAGGGDSGEEAQGE